MYELTDFYEYCQNQGVEVGLHPLPAPAMTLRDGDWYCVGLDFAKLGTIRALRTATMHELGHLRTGALHKVDSPYQLVAQSEYRANADSFGRYLNPQALRQAMESPDWGRQAAQKTRQNLLEHFTWQIVTEQLLGIAHLSKGEPLC